MGVYNESVGSFDDGGMGGRGTLATQRWRGGLTFAGLIVAMVAAYAAIAGVSVSVLGDSPLQAVRAAAISGTAGGVPLFPLASPSAVLPFSAIEIASAATRAPAAATGAPRRPPGGGLEGSNGGTTPPPTGPGGGTRPPGQPEYGHAQHHESAEHHERREPRRGEHGKHGRSRAHRPRPHRPPHHHHRSHHAHD